MLTAKFEKSICSDQAGATEGVAICCSEVMTAADRLRRGQRVLHGVEHDAPRSPVALAQDCAQGDS